MFLLIVFFLISITFSFLCSIWEAVLLSITSSYVEIKSKEGSSVGLKLKNYKENIDRPLSAILTLNTIAHTVGAIGVGAQAGKVFGSGYPTIGGMEMPFNYESIVATVMTLAILILSEIIPKTLGANYWRTLAPFTVQSLSVIMFLLAPLVWLSQLITKALKKDKGKSVLSRADFFAMARIGEKEGAIKKGEFRIIDNLLKFETIQAKDVMTPRTVLKAAPQDQSIKDFYQENKNLRFSRIPIFEETVDQITGFVLKDKLLSDMIDNNGTSKLKDIKREIMVVNEDMPLPQLFNTFVEKREHIALVVDKFGGVAGVATMEDAIETLIGMEIVDEYDNIDDMQSLARKNWEKRAKNLGIISPEVNEKEI